MNSGTWKVRAEPPPLFAFQGRGGNKNDLFSRRLQPAVYTVFHEESEYEVQNGKILQKNLNNSISF